MDAEQMEQLERWHREEAHQKIVNAIQALPEEARDYRLTGLLARAMNNLGDYEGAIRQLLSVCRQGEDDPVWHFRLGYAYFYLDRDEEARGEFARVLELDPEDQDARMLLGALMCPVCYTEEEMEAVEAYIGARFGTVKSVLHELVSPDIHLDICVVEPTPQRNYYTLVTMGMGARPMNVPESLRGEGLERAELVVCLPPDWKIESGEEAWYWPLYWLKLLGRLPGDEDSWLGWGHTIPNDGPFAENTDLCCMLLLEAFSAAGEQDCLLPDGSRVNFYQMIPLYQEEMEYKLAHDAQALLERMEELSPVIDLERTNWCEGFADPEALEELEEEEEEEPICFRARVEAFWAWFLEHEPTLAEMVEHREHYEGQEIVAFISEGTSLISEDLHFNVGGQFEFTFSADGEERFYHLMPYVVARMPEELEGKWRFSPFMPSAGGADFALEMYGRRISAAQVRVGIEETGKDGRLRLSFYEENLAAMEEDEAVSAFYVLMQISIGEGLTRIYVDRVDRADGPEEGMFPLIELEAGITANIQAAGQELITRPDQRFTVYRFDPEANEELRYDVITGMTCCTQLVEEYYGGSTDLLDEFADCGASAVFLAFPYYGEEARDKALEDRHSLEDRLEREVLGIRGDGEEIGVVLGGCMGASCGYIDLLLYDGEEFRARVTPLLQEYPYKFYLSPFRQHCALELLSAPEEPEYV